MVRCASIAAVSVAAGLVLLSVATSSAGLISGAAILSLGIAFTFPSLSAMALSSLTDQTERASLIGSFGMFFEVGAGLGGFLIGPVARSAGLPSAFRVAAFAPLLALIVLRARRYTSLSGQNARSRTFG